jgi:hypothetical protein
MVKMWLMHLDGWKHTKPPKNCSHMYNFFATKFFGNVWTSHLGLVFKKKKYTWLVLDLI